MRVMPLQPFDVEAGRGGCWLPVETRMQSILMDATLVVINQQVGGSESLVALS